eukprot:PhF_6_TR29413/c0_g1_i1/m.43464/K01256/pepN; aminopeptidase N
MIRLEDYQPPSYQIPAVQLTFTIFPFQTVVESTFTVHVTSPLVKPNVLSLHGNLQSLQEVTISINGVSAEFEKGDVLLGEVTVNIPESVSTTHMKTTKDFSFDVATRVIIHPHLNTALEGLYISEGVYCTQCEPTFFRNITLFPDRPDVLSVYTVRITSYVSDHNTLLSNGELIEPIVSLPDGSVTALWHDPYPKPTYLFALIAGNLKFRSANFRTASGKEVEVNVFALPHQYEETAFALQCILRAMAWDEETFGFEYDLPSLNLVSVRDNNMEAMENKSLLIFEKKLLLASASTATDEDHALVDRLVAHEYFHNWTGNRVTIRDWFQLTAKEGLTVFRDQMYCASTKNMTTRIKNVRELRARQFCEDAGPLRHSIRPTAYTSMDTFYTATVYRKGAEVVRMFHTLLDTAGFTRGLQLYTKRHDGHSVTCEDFVQALFDGNLVNPHLQYFEQMKLWYKVSGTPHVEITNITIDRKNHVTFEVTQSGVQSLLVIPINVAIVTKEHGVIAHFLCILHQAQQHFKLQPPSNHPIMDSHWTLSVFRDFSAPVTFHVEGRTFEQCHLLATKETDSFVKYDALQYVLRELIHAHYVHDHSRCRVAFACFAQSAAAILQREDGNFIATSLSLPTFEDMLLHICKIHPEGVNPVELWHAFESTRHSIQTHFFHQLLDIVSAHNPDELYEFNEEQTNARARVSWAVEMLTSTNHEKHNVIFDLFVEKLRMSQNLTSAYCFMRGLVLLECSLLPSSGKSNEAMQTLLTEFGTKWNHYKQFYLQALLATSSSVTDCIAKTLDPTNPTNVYEIAHGCWDEFFSKTYSADGVRDLVNLILTVDAVNPTVAAVLSERLSVADKLCEPFKTYLSSATEELKRNEKVSVN